MKRLTFEGTLCVPVILLKQLGFRLFSMGFPLGFSKACGIFEVHCTQRIHEDCGSFKLPSYADMKLCSKKYNPHHPKFQCRCPVWLAQVDKKVKPTTTESTYGGRKFKLPTIWTDEKQRWEESEKKREEERRSKRERVRRKKIQVREKVGKSPNTVFPMICGSAR